jgi:hypothetical protein
MRACTALLLLSGLAIAGAAESTERPSLPAFLDLPPALDDVGTGLPEQLSGTGAFEDAMALRPKSGFRYYTVNQPLWSDGATKHRWVMVPEQTTITAPPDAPWTFAPGTVFIKHFAMPLDLRKPDGPERRLETRLLVVRPGGDVYGVTYRWPTDGGEATLVAAEGAYDELEIINELGEPERFTWNYPSRENCIACHTPESGGVLGVSTRQLNRVGVDGRNQVAQFSMAGWLDRKISEAECSELPRLSHLDDLRADPATRIRSYLDANCSSCHHPASRVGEDAFSLDLRSVTPLMSQGIIDIIAHNGLDLVEGKVIHAGDPDRSVLVDRVGRRDIYGMPPLGTARVDQAFLSALKAWIDSMPESAQPQPQPQH